MSMPGENIALTDTDESKLIDRIEQELGDALDDHRDKEEQLDKWDKAYKGEPEHPKKDFPFPNACNIVIPLIGIAVDSIVARIVNTLYSVEPFWSARPLRKEVEQHVKQIERFMEWSRKNEYPMYAQTRKWVPEIVKYGIGYFKVPWSISQRRTFAWDDNFNRMIPKEETIRRPYPHHVPLRDIITQCGIDDPLGQSEFFTQRLRLTDGELYEREYEGIYTGIDDIIKHKEDIPGSNRPRLNTLYEIWANVPLFADAKLPESALLTYHRPKRKLIRAIYNPIATGVRPYVGAKFIENGSGQIGIAEKLWYLQDEIGTLHRQQVDNATIANTRFFLGKRGAVRPNTRVWPGRFLTVGDPERDVKAVQLGDIYPSMFRLSTEILSFSERASGVSDPFLGRESSVVGTRATATGTLAILQEGNKRFDLNVRDIRDALGTVGRMVLELNQQFRPRGIAFFVLGEEGELVEEILNLPNEFLSSRLSIELTASTATINKQVEQQGLISLLGLLTQYYERLLQIGLLIANPNVPDSAKALGIKMVEGARRVMERILQTYDVRDIDAVLPTLMAEMEEGSNGSRGFEGFIAGNQDQQGMV